MFSKIIKSIFILSVSLSFVALTSCKSKDKLPDINGGDNSQITTLDGNAVAGIDTTGAVSFNEGGSDTGGISGLNTIFFDYDSSRLTEKNKQLLSDNAKWLRVNPGLTLLIEGHCDQRGSTEYNLALGERRAQTVKNYLIGIGVDPTSLTIISYGKERLLEMSDAEASFGKNRRANFVPVR